MVHRLQAACFAYWKPRTRSDANEGGSVVVEPRRCIIFAILSSAHPIGPGASFMPSWALTLEPLLMC
ncbi:hypothetical protein CPAR01_13951 [Colletotrichum paranaense]|uniref:Uncharacterized protein n=2 Tax=Colletotrichum acutatum species complex TaxID=2707335 RepID=A0AAI9UQ08_9PEZI|nr:uncharacterized protein CPAR01_13951 [Colletotrichum paranaense]KAK1462368.1 hypothetical protein CMEL01_14335 [Colletotrichum melonis]KAK1523098.1 hypothetical protein CPAR01_13951 [Colletotrichum paranaense]